MLFRSHAVHPIADVQLEYSLMSRGIEAEILPALRELGIAVTAYGVLSRGLLSGSLQPGASDIRTQRLPRFQGENLTRNLALVEALAAVARRKGATAAQLATAWVACQGKDILPLIGARTRERLSESLAAGDLKLTAQDLAEIEHAVPAEAVAGTRYEAAQMAHLDSEKPRAR